MDFSSPNCIYKWLAYTDLCVHTYPCRERKETMDQPERPDSRVPRDLLDRRDSLVTRGPPDRTVPMAAMVTLATLGGSEIL